MKKLPTLSLPGAIVIAGVLIALAIAFTAKPATGINAPTEPPPEVDNTALLEQVDPITNSDHILGKIDAPITVVEYSDLDCPFCERFHGIMQQILSEYNGRVRWVYRHFPLDFHPEAINEAKAVECYALQRTESAGSNYANIGAEQTFAYIKRLLEIPSSTDGFDIEKIVSAFPSGSTIDRAAFEKCLKDSTILTKIQNESANGAATGGTGTPWSIVIGPNGQMQSINGAQPYTVVKSIIDGMQK